FAPVIRTTLPSGEIATAFSFLTLVASNLRILIDTSVSVTSCDDVQDQSSAKCGQSGSCLPSLPPHLEHTTSGLAGADSAGFSATAFLPFAGLLPSAAFNSCVPSDLSDGRNVSSTVVLPSLMAVRSPRSVMSS